MALLRKAGGSEHLKKDSASGQQEKDVEKRVSRHLGLGLDNLREPQQRGVLDPGARGARMLADATQLSILVDSDTGYGNFNNVRRLVRKLCERHIAGLCIEDKLFSKTSSFIGAKDSLFLPA